MTITLHLSVTEYRGGIRLISNSVNVHISMAFISGNPGDLRISYIICIICYVADSDYVIVNCCLLMVVAGVKVVPISLLFLCTAV